MARKIPPPALPAPSAALTPEVILPEDATREETDEALGLPALPGERKKALRPLTWKERLFVDAYVGKAKLVPSRAAKLAGYQFPHQSAHQLLRRIPVRVAIRAKSKAALSKDEIVARLSEQATLDAATIARCYKDTTRKVGVDKNGELIETDWRVVDWDMVKRLGIGHLISAVDLTKYGEVIKFHDRVAVLALLSKIEGLQVDVHKHGLLKPADIEQMGDEELQAIAEGRE